MLTKTSLTHPTTLNNLRKACYNVLKQSYSVDHVRNRQGNAYIAVRRYKGFLVFLDRYGNDITRQVASVLKRKKVTFWR